MKKWIISTLFATLILFAFTHATFEAEAARDVTVYVDGQQVFFPDQSPVIINGHTFVPVRGVFENLGFVIDWDGSTQTVTLFRHDYTIVLPVGSQTFTTNGATFHLNEPARLIGGRTMLPLRLPLESIGYSLDWDSATFSVFITSPQMLMPGPGGTPPPRQPEVVFTPTIPPGGYREHFIEPGQSLAFIAQIYWPHNPETPSGRIIRDNLVEHLARTNNIANPEVIFAGTWLRIYEHPQIQQVFDFVYVDVPPMPPIMPGETPPPRGIEVIYRPIIPQGGYREHFIEPGQSLASIVQIYWPHNPETPSGRQIRDQLIFHLMSTNSITDPTAIFAGMWIRIYEHPQIQQVFD